MRESQAQGRPRRPYDGHCGPRMAPGRNGPTLDTCSVCFGHRMKLKLELLFQAHAARLTLSSDGRGCHAKLRERKM